MEREYCKNCYYCGECAFDEDCDDYSPLNEDAGLSDADAFIEELRTVFRKEWFSYLEDRGF